MRGGGQTRIGGVAALLATLAALALALPGAAPAAFDCGAYVERCQASIDDSGRVWFNSVERLTEDALGDGTVRRGVFQVYERTATTTRLLTGPDGQPIKPDFHRSSAYLNGASPDGQRVYVTTLASLSPEDHDDGLTDASADSYEISAAGFRLLTTGPVETPSGQPFAGTGARIVWAADDGAHVYFITNDGLVPEDVDGVTDVYARIGSVTRLVSTGPGFIPPEPPLVPPPTPQPWFLGASTDGATAYFATPEQLTADDTEGMTSDIFAWRDGTTRRLTRTVKGTEGPGGVWETFDSVSFGGAAADGTIIFTAFSRQAGDDVDALEDVYAARPDGSLQRLTGPGLDPGAPTFLRAAAISRDGGRVFLLTTRAFVPQDTDRTPDVYMWSGGAYTLVTEGLRGNPPDNAEEVHLNAISRDGSRAYFTTYERLDPADTDDKPDVYEWADGRIRLVSPASDGRQAYAFFRGISPNGRYVAFATFEPLLDSDNDADEDIYLVDMGPAAASASASRTKKRSRRAERRLRLVTAEAIAPRMRVGRRGAIARGRARIRLRCPRAERSGPCRGRVTLAAGRRARPLGRGKFRIAPGRARAVVIRGRPLSTGRLPARRTLQVRVQASDRLGNSATVSSPVRFRR